MAEAEFKIYGALPSPVVRTVLCFFKVTGVPYQFEFINVLAGQNKTPEYLAINPHGTIPGMTHGDFPLTESAAMIQYTAEAKGISSNWWPGDLKEKAKVLSFIHWNHTAVYSKLVAYFFKGFGGPKFLGKNFPEEEVNAAKAEVDTTMEKLNGFLAESNYIADTNQPSAADLFLFSNTEQIVFFPQYDLSPYPNVEAWYNRMMEVEGVREIHEELVKFVESKSVE